MRSGLERLAYAVLIILVATMTAWIMACLLYTSFLPLAVVLIALQFLPELIPAHYDMNNQVTRWGLSLIHI